MKGKVGIGQELLIGRNALPWRASPASEAVHVEEFSVTREQVRAVLSFAAHGAEAPPSGP
jgi:uncharacterized protein (DUF433 family)